MRKIINIGLAFFFFLMLVFPASYQVPRGIFLVIMILFSLRHYAIKRFRIYAPILNLAVLNVAASCVFFMNGFVRNQPGAVTVTTVFIIWPILYTYFIGFCINRSQMRILLRCLIFGALGSVIFITIMILWMLGFLPIDLTTIADSQDFSVSWTGGAVEINSLNLATVMYCFIFSLTYFLFPKHYIFGSIVSRKLNLVTLIGCFVIILLSARRAFWVVGLMAPVIVIAIFKLARVKISLSRYILPLLFITMALVALFAIFALSNELLVKELMSSFDFNNPNEGSNYIRLEQYNALISGWERNPIFGAGLGAPAPGSIRDPLSPWAYELSYLALLFHTGIVGFAIYCGSVFWIGIKSIQLSRISKDNAVILLPQLVALIGFLLINSSNPYLAKFDYLWTIFLPVASINAIMISSAKEVLNES